MEEELRETLKPLYAELLPLISTEHKVCPFCLQWGHDFPKGKNTGILFVGKATNDWGSDSRDIEVIFGNAPERKFAKEDQMVWVENRMTLSYVKLNGGYNARRSAFWRLIKNLTQSIYKNDPWYSKIAWSNLYKVNPRGGNPNAKLKSDQIVVCKKILSKEIEVLSPKFVVFLTSDWESEFIKNLNHNEEIKWIYSKKWGIKDDETKVFQINGTYFICSKHPQGKNEYNHLKAIIDIIDKYSTSFANET